MKNFVENEEENTQINNINELVLQNIVNTKIVEELSSSSSVQNEEAFNIESKFTEKKEPDKVTFLLFIFGLTSILIAYAMIIDPGFLFGMFDMSTKIFGMTLDYFITLGIFTLILLTISIWHIYKIHKKKNFNINFIFFIINGNFYNNPIFPNNSFTYPNDIWFTYT